MKKILFAFVLLLSFFGNSQTFDFGQPRGYSETYVTSLMFHKMPSQNNAILLANEIARRKQNFDKMLYFGTIINQNVSIPSLGNITVLENGDRISSYAISSPGAVSINLIFNDFYLSNGATLYIYNKEKTKFIGAHTSLNNNVSNVIGTDLIFSDNCIIELYEPKKEIGQSRLNLQQVIHGFEDIEITTKDLEESGNCEYDVNCPIGSGWENQRNSAIMLVAGSGVCSAALVNNVLNDFTPYVLTANHCSFNAAWVYRFRWETPVGQTVCGIAGISGNGPETFNINGGTLKASSAGSDFLLTLLNSTPNPSWNIYYAGWDKSGNLPASAVGIHHPAGDIKKISFENDPLVSSTYAGNPPNTYWEIPTWDDGVTEGGSSGSPIFDQNKRIVGQLHGGPSFCGGSNLKDYYGKFSTSWEGNGTNSTRLKNWLDPSNSNTAAIDGIDPATGAALLDGSVSNVTDASGTICGASVTPKFTLFNPATTALTSATITYGYNGSLSQTYNWIGNLAQNTSTIITLPAQTFTSGNQTISILLTQINGSTDPIVTNNSATSAFITSVNGRIFDLEMKLDCYGSENSWEIRNRTGVLIEAGGPYTNQVTPQIIIQESFCLSDTCFKFKIIDSNGDGMFYASCPITGSTKITNSSGVVVVEVLASEAPFTVYNGDSITKFVACYFASVSDLERTEFSLYPNPTSNNATLKFGELIGAKNIQLIDASGKILYSVVTVQNEIELPVSQFVDGIYFVSIHTELGKVVQRIVKD